MWGWKYTVQFFKAKAACLQVAGIKNTEWIRTEHTRRSEPSGYGIRTTCSVCWITVRLPQTPSLFLLICCSQYSYTIILFLFHREGSWFSETLGNSPQLTWLAGEGQDVKVHAHVTETLCCPNCSKSQTSKINCISPKMWMSALGPLLSSLVTVSTHCVKII